MPIADKRYLSRTMNRLYGMIEGLTIDCQLNEKEIVSLYDWMERHVYFEDVEPFKGLWCLLNDILEDQIIDHDEKEELLEWCSETINNRGFLSGFTEVFRSLHGILGGIIADEKITKDELIGLQDWLLDYEKFKDWWPLNEITTLIEDVLEDGKIDSNEHKMLLNFFSDFVEQALEHITLHDKEYMFDDNLRSHSPFFKPISTICKKNPMIVFPSKKFCFTGPAVTGSRKDLSSIVTKLGGKTHNTIVNNLNYLIIGAQSSPAWIYSTYGRKIETAMQKNKNKKQIELVKEQDFINAAIKVGGPEVLPNPDSPPFELTF